MARKNSRMDIAECNKYVAELLQGVKPEKSKDVKFLNNFFHGMGYLQKDCTIEKLSPDVRLQIWGDVKFLVLYYVDKEKKARFRRIDETDFIQRYETWKVCGLNISWKGGNVSL